MNRQKTLVFFGAHPDDESFGVGSTLAQYAVLGVRVYYVCSTGGESGTVDPKHLQGYASIKQLRLAEMKCAAQVLGLAGVFDLGYRDSGMRGSEDNKLPDALVMAPIEEVTGRMVKIIREIKPDVVITHDAGGGYGHPDHIATHNATVKAFYAANDPEQYPEVGSMFQPRKLYFAVRTHKLLKIMVNLMPLFGQDPHHFGRNGDVDLTNIASVEYQVHAVIRLKKQSTELRNKAMTCHASQSSGRPRQGPFRILQMIEKLLRSRDYFMRANPSPTSKRKEKDLFEGVG